MSRDASSLSGLSKDWRRRIFRLACQLNFGWWLDAFLLLFLGLSLLCMCALLLARRQGWSEIEVWKIFGWALLPLAGAAFFWARRRFENLSSARVRLEYALGLNNRLTAAEAGVCDWPEARAGTPEVLRWRWRPVLSQGSAACFLLLAGAFLPVPPDEAKSLSQAVKPPVLEQLESWVETLEENRLVEDEPLQELKQEVEQLSARPPEEWYSHGNLEASDHLRDQLQNKLQALRQDLQTAEGALGKMDEERASLSESQMSQLSMKLAEALQGAQMGQLPLNARFMENMPEIDPAKLRNITPEQARAMMEKMKEAQAGLKKCEGGNGDPVAALVMLEAELMMPGGGINRGPGSVPLTLNPNPSEVGSTKIEGMSNDDLSRASLGETVGLSKGNHDGKPPQYQGLSAGGSAAQGAGGEAVWVNQLTPAEQAQVKTFFK